MGVLRLIGEADAGKVQYYYRKEGEYSENRRFQKFYLLSAAGAAAMAAYPVAMGVRVTVEMLRNGAVLMENYPKYVIPYPPITVALLLGVLLMPGFQRFSKKAAFF